MAERETRTLTCRCGETVELTNGWANACRRCGQEYNGAGQRLRPGWRDNPSLRDEDVDDLTGFEMAELRRERGR